MLTSLKKEYYISLFLLLIGFLTLAYLHLFGTGLLIGIAASMPGSEAVGGEFLPKETSSISCEVLHQLFPHLKEAHSVVTEPTPIANPTEVGSHERFIKFSKEGLNISSFSGKAKWGLSMASSQPVCLHSVGEFIKHSTEIIKPK